MIPKLSEITKWLSILLLTAIGSISVFGPMDLSYLTFSGDDAGYYFGIAQNACLGKGWTFDGLERTNGFNPLFTGLLSLVFWLVPECDMELSYRIGLGLSVISVIISVYFLRAILRRLSVSENDNYYVWPLIWVVLGFIGTKRMYGLDAPLLLMCGLGYFHTVLQSSPKSTKWGDVIKQGVWLGLLVMARLDSLAFLAAAVGVSVLLSYTDPKAMVRNALKGGVATTMMLPWVIWSTQYFGTWMPVSAKIKSAFPHINLQVSLNTILHTSISTIDLTLLGIAFGVALFEVIKFGFNREWKQLQKWEAKQQLMMILSLYVLGRLSYMLLFSRADVQGGYVVLIHIYLMLQLWFLVRDKAIFQKPWVQIVLILIGLIGVGHRAESTSSMLSSLSGTQKETQIQFANRMKESLPKEGVIFGGFFGIMGYVAERPWVNLDGVVNTFDYQKMIRDDQLSTYMDDRNIQYAVFFHKGEISSDNPLTFIVRSFQYDVVHRIIIPEENIVLSSQLVDRQPHKTLIVAKIPR